MAILRPFGVLLGVSMSLAGCAIGDALEEMNSNRPVGLGAPETPTEEDSHGSESETGSGNRPAD